MKKGSHTTEPCKWWYAYFFDNPLRRFFHDPYALFSPYLRDGMTAVDVGCGMGYFSIAMARMVGPNGLVYAADIQQRMLDVMSKRAARAGVGGIVMPHLCGPASIGLGIRADFVLTFWVLHEIQDPGLTVKELASILKPGGFYFLAEPKGHVDADTVRRLSAMPVEHGMVLTATPRVSMSHAFVYEKK